MEIIIAATMLMGVLLAFLFVIPQIFKPSVAKTDAPNNNNNKISQGSKRYTKAEVSLHDKRTDCWVIIKNKVYDVTSYVEEHPGGDAILTNAGGDSTEGFYGPQHGTRVFDIIEDFCVGELDE